MVDVAPFLSKIS